jgi:predicted porin
MNKKLITIAVAAAMVVPMAVSAETTLYGRINNSVVYTDYDDPDTPSENAFDEEWDVKDNASRVGVKGSEDLGNGLKAIFQWEAQIETADGGSTYDGIGQRLGFVGLSGDWGTFAIGRQWTPYYGSVDKTDIFNLPSMDDYYLGLYRTGNALAYISPSWNGLTGKLALVVDEEQSDNVGNGESTVDIANLSIDYNNGPLSLGVSYAGFYGDDDPRDFYQVGAAGKYTFNDMFAIIGQFEYVDDDLTLDDGTQLELTSWAVAGEYYFGNNTIRALYGVVTDDGDVDKDWNVWSIGFQHNFSKRTRVFVEYQDSEINQTSTESYSLANLDSIEGEATKFGVGIRHDF